MSRPSRLATALFALSFAVAGVIGAIYAFVGEDTYRDLVMPDEPETIALPSDGTSYARELLVLADRETTAYVLGGPTTLPRTAAGAALFTDGEASHLADVRLIFEGVRIALVVALLVLVALGARARLRRHLMHLMQDGALWAAAVLVALAIVVVVAFEPAFMAMHYVLFPQGNFLFDPATSNLLLVYPERYWYGITLRVGATFIAMALAVAAAAALAGRWRSPARVIA